MARRVVKESRDWYGVKKSANEVIKECLARGDGYMFGEIQSYLQDLGIHYSKKGLHLRLENLMKQGIIEKKLDGGKPYPTYYLKVRSSDYSSLGWWLNYYVDQVLSRGNSLKMSDRTRFRLMTTLIGVFAIYAEIQSWRLASKKKSHKEQFRIRSSFLQEAVPLLTMTTKNEFKDRFFDLGFVPGMYKENEYRNKMYEYEKFLKKSFSLEYKLCKEAFEVALEASKVLPGFKGL